MKRWFTLVLSIAIVLSLAGCTDILGRGSQPPGTGTLSSEQITDSPGKELTLWMVAPVLGNPIWEQARKGWEQAAEELGFTAEYKGPTGQDKSELINIMESAIAMEVDGILAALRPKDMFNSTVQRCADNGVAVVVGDEDMPTGAVGYVGFNVEAQAKQVAGALEQIVQEKDIVPKLLVIQSTLSDDVVPVLLEAVNETLGKYEGYELIAIDECGSDKQTAMDKISQYLLAHPEINLIFTPVAEGAPAAAAVFRENNYQDIYVLGYDAYDETVQGIKDGTIYGTLVQNFYYFGYTGAYNLYNYLTTGTWDTGEPTSGMDLYTIDNIDSYSAG